jgi:hypothetical protein
VKLTDDELLPESDTIGDNKEVGEEAQLQELRKKFVERLTFQRVRVFMSSKCHYLTNAIRWGASAQGVKAPIRVVSHTVQRGKPHIHLVVMSRRY